MGTASIIYRFARTVAILTECSSFLRTVWIKVQRTSATRERCLQRITTLTPN